MPETTFAGTAPFPDETVDGWSISWLWAYQRSPFPHQNRTALALVAERDGERLQHGLRLAEYPPTPEALERARAHLILWLRGVLRTRAEAEA